MPILPQEPAVFPETLLDATDILLDDVSRWWVLHTRPRAEKALARRLSGLGVSFFLPLYRRTWRLNGRKLTSFLPLFPGYMFLLADDQGRFAALDTKLVSNAIFVDDQPRLHEDLVRVHRLMVSDAPLAPEERIVPGMSVEITKGPLAGFVGKVIRRGNRLRFLVEVHFLQRGASVEVEGWMLESVEPSAGPLCGAR